MKRGGIKERTTRDPNELVTLNDSVKIILYNKNGEKLDVFALIDDEDVKFIKGKKIGFGKFGEKKYCYLTEKGKIVLLHRYIWEKHFGKIPKDKVVDHINGNGLDCRMKNLRLASSLENSYNLSRPNKFTGVNPSGGRFNARIMHNRRDYNLGTFDTLKEALDARLDAERKFFGDFGPNVSRYDRGLINYSTSNTKTRRDAEYFLFPNFYNKIAFPKFYNVSINRKNGDVEFLDEAFINPAKNIYEDVKDISSSKYQKSLEEDKQRLISFFKRKNGDDFFEKNPKALSYLDEMYSPTSNKHLKSTKADLTKLVGARGIEGLITTVGSTAVVGSLGKSVVKKTIPKIISPLGTAGGGLSIAADVVSGEYKNKKSDEWTNSFQSEISDPRIKTIIEEGIKNNSFGGNDSVSDEELAEFLSIYYKDDKEFNDLFLKGNNISNKNITTIESTDNKGNGSSMAIPLMLSGAALAGFYLWQKNKEKKKKKKDDE